MGTASAAKAGAVIPLETLVGPVAALGLALLIIYQFMAGKLLSRNVVPREDFDRVVGINESYAARFSEQTEAVKQLSATVAAQSQRVARGTRGTGK